MKKLMMIAVAALCCVVLADGPERGERRPGGPRGGMGGMRHHEMGMDPIVFAVSRPQVVEKLGLSDEQKEKLKAVTDRARDGREGMKKVSAYSVDGRLVKTFEANETECRIEGLERGVYLVRMETVKGIVIRKVVKM